MMGSKTLIELLRLEANQDPGSSRSRANTLTITTHCHLDFLSRNGRLGWEEVLQRRAAQTEEQRKEHEVKARETSEGKLWAWPSAVCRAEVLPSTASSSSSGRRGLTRSTSCGTRKGLLAGASFTSSTVHFLL